VLGCGGPEAAVVSHRSAAALLDLVRIPSGPVEVITLGQSGATRAIRVHRSSTLDRARDVGWGEDGLPLTSLTRTLVDLADVMSPHFLERACHRAEMLGRLDAGALHARLDELPGRRARALRAVLAGLARADPDVTRSELEERFLELVKRAGLPRPRVNARVGPYEVDFLWAQQRLVAETDGAAAHLTPSAFEADRKRDEALTVAGFHVVRFTWRRVVHEPTAVARALGALLARR
jgi:very-short-patch-repair endonuclease